MQSWLKSTIYCPAALLAATEETPACPACGSDMVVTVEGKDLTSRSLEHDSNKGFLSNPAAAALLSLVGRNTSTPR